MICEGLAYLNFCYLPLDTSLLKHIKEEEEESNNKNDTHGPSTERTPIDSLIRVAKTWDSEQLKETWIERVKSKYDETFHPELVPAGFQWHLSKILNEPHPIATELPSWIKEIPSSDELWKSMYQAMVYLYLSMRTPALVQNDDSKEQEYNGGFVLLHLMTSLWGLEHIVKSLKRRDGSDISDEIDRTAIGIYYANMIILTATSVAGFPSVSALQKTREEFPLTIAETDTDTDTDDNFNWDKIVERALKEEEEHNIKLVYIMKELWKRYDHWSGFYEAARSFTVTPNIGPKSTKTDA
mmetsp:Transcript_10256/g.14720  ORF Transcript_10256/g.14720 Transcript_10256/m.14720 type:complete len:297 (+) Transcript_10256:437-1327(+)